MTSGRRALSTLACVLAFASVGAPSVALAQPSQADLDAARRTFNEGKDLEKAGNYSAAVERFKKVAEVRVTPQVRFHIALCEENLGKLVSALKGFELAGEEARQAGSSAIEVSENAPSRAEALRKRVAHLKIQVTGRLSTSKLTLDGMAVSRESFGVDQLVDPGKHRVILETSGAPAFDKDIELKEAGTETVVVEVNDRDGSEVVPPGGGGGAPVVPPPSKTPAYVFGGVGIGGIVLGGVFMGLAQIAKSDVKAQCPQEHNCPLSLESEGNRGKTFYTTSFIVGGIGAASLAAGVAMFVVLTPKKPKSTTGAALVLAPTVGGASLSGSF